MPLTYNFETFHSFIDDLALLMHISNQCFYQLFRDVSKIESD